MKRQKRPTTAGGKNDKGTVDYSTLLFGDDRPDSEKIRSVGILLEDINSKMSLVIEKVDSSEERLTAKIDELRTEHGARLASIEAIVSHHSKILNEHSERFTMIDKQLLRIENRLDRIDDKFDNHENRICLIEKSAIPESIG